MPEPTLPPSSTPPNSPPAQPNPPPQPPVVPPTPNPAPNPPVDDPLVTEYADALKAELGKVYDEAFDKLPLKDRIAAMKIAKMTMNKIGVRSEGKPPVGPDPAAKNQIKDHVDRWAAGERDPVSNAVCNFIDFRKK